MRKGDVKKQKILKTAEEMFCRKGYVETSVQDILDALNTSKGSFYHHYPSKDALLAEICGQRAEAGSELTFEKIQENQTAIQSLNILLSGMIPLNGEKLMFLLMLLPVFDMPEGVQVRHAYKRELSRVFVPKIAEVIRKGTEDESFCCPDPDFAAETLALLVNEFWSRTCDIIIENEKKGVLADAGELLATADAYRIVIERMIYARYGSVGLISLHELEALTEQIHLHWKK